MRKTILSNFLVNRMILLTAVMYHFINGSLYFAGLVKFGAVFAVLHQYADLSGVSEQGLMAYFALWAVLYFGMVALLFALWFRPYWLFFVFIFATNLTITILRLYFSGFKAHFSIIFEWVLVVLIGISFSALILRHFIRIKIAARKLAEASTNEAHHPSDEE
ncbi:MAG: hypothetical protein H3C41_04305 [Bacteroidales bacterium]|nr:hypothetical protein [Bacteroidales bacterium]